MAEQHLEKTISTLLSQREQKVAEVAKLDAAIEAIKKLMGPGTAPEREVAVQATDNFTFQDSVPAVGVATVLGGAIKPGDFFGKAQAEAAQEYLRRIGHAAGVGEIFMALQKGGAKLKGRDPKKNLYISLVKKKDVFPMVAPYTFGLWEFYPGARGKSGGGGVAAQLKEVMQDGKPHRITEILALLQEEFAQKFSRSSVVAAIHRSKEFRKIRRGTYKLVKT